MARALFLTWRYAWVFDAMQCCTRYLTVSFLFTFKQRDKRFALFFWTPRSYNVNNTVEPRQMLFALSEVKRDAP